MVGGISRGQRQYRLTVTMVTICVSPPSFLWLFKCPSPLETADVNVWYQPDYRCGRGRTPFLWISRPVVSSAKQCGQRNGEARGHDDMPRDL